MYHLVFGISFPIYSITSSCTCQPISIHVYFSEKSYQKYGTYDDVSFIIPALIIQNSILSLQAQNLPFQQIFSTLDFFTYWTASW